MAKNLVIVESPAKAKTIEKFLGKDFSVQSCFGHIRDLPKTQLSIDVEADFTPKYVVPADKKKLVESLVKEAKKAEFVWLASDEDREGEAIAWHLESVLKLEKSKIKRIVFNEITKTAILKAIENPRELDYDLVDAQQARRVLDRIVGYEISPILWRKVKPSLSAGRVQSVAVRLVVEREDEIKNFNEEAAFKVTAYFKELAANLSVRFTTKEEVKEFLKACSIADFKVQNVEKKPSKRSPSAPFTTSTLQQEASRKLGFSVSRTMVVAQQLYENGYITYMRTDSVNLSNFALNAIGEQISATYGKEYINIKKYATKVKGAQEAHEAIRPTAFDRKTISGDNSAVKLYDLIWKRTIASQMSDARLEKTIIDIEISNRKESFIATGEVLLFDGFLKVYSESFDDEDSTTDNEDKLLPTLSVGENLSLQKIGAKQVYSQHKPRYSEASLVKKLEELGIGRPSTYAPTISTIQKREYVVKEDRTGTLRNYIYFELNGKNIEEKLLQENTGVEKHKLFPTDIGNLVNQFLTENFPKILDYNFTAGVEKQFDEIAQGKQKWTKMIGDFYNPFHTLVEEVSKNSERVVGERLVGVDPDSGLNIYVRLGRFGPMVQKGESNIEDVKPTFASLKKGQSMDELSLDEALELFKLPRSLGNYEDKEMVVAIGRFGPYIKHNSAFVSIPKGEEPLDITKERAVEIIEAKRLADKEKLINIFPTENGDIQVLNGRFGPYITYNKSNYKIPKTTDAKALSMEECVKIIETTPKTDKKKSSGRRFGSKK